MENLSSFTLPLQPLKASCGTHTHTHVFGWLSAASPQASIRGLTAILQLHISPFPEEDVGLCFSEMGRWLPQVCHREGLLSQAPGPKRSHIRFRSTQTFTCGEDSPVVALSGNRCEQPGVVKCLGWLNATALGCYANVYIPDVTHATESACHELSVCSPRRSHTSRLWPTHSWVRGETLRKNSI